MSENKVLVIFGSTGDLTFTKLLPALNQLILSKPKALTNIILIGRQVETLSQYLELGASKGLVQKDIEAVYPLLNYLYLQASIKEDYGVLKTALDSVEYRYYYLATPPSMFVSITEALSEHHLLDHSNLHHCIAFEKPFGADASDAASLSTLLHRFVDETQLYRVDHYLAKPMIEKLPLFHRLFSGFSPKFSNDALSSIDIVAYETHGISTRGKFYEATGAILDMIQSHLLLTLSKAFFPEHNQSMHQNNEMETPFFNQLKVDPTQCVVGQYIGYRQEAHVAPFSEVETYAYIPFTYPRLGKKPLSCTIATGKKLDYRDVSITYTFENGAILTVLLSPKITWKANALFLSLIHDNQRQLLDDFIASIDPSLHAYTQVFNYFAEGNKSIFPDGEVVNATWNVVKDIFAVKPKLTFYQSLKDLVK
jgi:glucose-6-phosphate 1-dehydrogenase